MADEHDRTASTDSQEAPLKPERVQEEAAEPAEETLKPERVQRKPSGEGTGGGVYGVSGDPGTGNG